MILNKKKKSGIIWRREYLREQLGGSNYEFKGA